MSANLDKLAFVGPSNIALPVEAGRTVDGGLGAVCGGHLDEQCDEELKEVKPSFRGLDRYVLALQGEHLFSEDGGDRLHLLRRVGEVVGVGLAVPTLLGLVDAVQRHVDGGGDGIQLVVGEGDVCGVLHEKE